tara:strand:- start:150 stop:581 length:432 start_codon:yes stop_codon:yes gene_type:complete
MLLVALYLDLIIKQNVIQKVSAPAQVEAVHNVRVSVLGQKPLVLELMTIKMLRVNGLLPICVRILAVMFVDVELDNIYNKVSVHVRVEAVPTVRVSRMDQKPLVLELITVKEMRVHGVKQHQSLAKIAPVQIFHRLVQQHPVA